MSIGNGPPSLVLQRYKCLDVASVSASQTHSRRQCFEWSCELARG